MPPKRQTAHPHDRRHENGLAPVGKRIQKQKSSNSLNDQFHANGKPKLPASSLPSSDVDQCMTSASSSSEGTANGISANAKMGGGRPGVGEAERTASEGSLNDNESCTLGNGTFDQTSRALPSKTDSGVGSSKSSAASKSNPLTLATTILSSCPLRDVIAILIILLQLPPTFLTIVNFLFATLTFVPPTTSTTISALPSLSDMFQGSGGTPSLATIVIADVIMLVFWIFLWIPARNLTLDLAQIVIAVSLGGAAGGKGGTTNSIVVCIIILLMAHTSQYKFIRQYWSSLVWLGMSKGGFKISDQPPVEHNWGSIYVAPSWLRSLLGVHILTQGIVRLIRRAISRRDSSPPIALSNKTDPEAAQNAALIRNNLTNTDPNPDVGPGANTDGRPPGLPPAPQAKEKVSTAKKKRKQATHVRSQQPFWAALASTKVTVLKEMEQTQASADAGEAGATDIHHIGNAKFQDKEEDRVWILEVGATEISFGVSLCRESEAVQYREETDANAGSGIDKSKPFYVRLNGADWTSTRIRRSGEGDIAEPSDTSGSAKVHAAHVGDWTGEIFGLTALSNYNCQFVRTLDNTVIYSASLITQPAARTEQAASVITTPPHQSLRPSSPTTTLKQSIAAAEQKLQENRNRLKQNRKVHKASNAAVKKEVESLNSRVSSSGGQDDRMRQKSLQLRQSMKQAEDAYSTISQQIDEIGGIPKEELQESAALRELWQEEADERSAAQHDFDAYKSEADREVGHAQNDINAATQKRDKLLARQAKLNEQYDRLTSANAQIQEAKARKIAERKTQAADRANQEQQWTSLIVHLERQREELKFRLMQNAQQIQHLEALNHQQQHSVPTTPEGILPGTVASRAMQEPFSNFQFPAQNARFMDSYTSRPTSLYHEYRPRSSSMLSGVSGFTEDIDDVPAGPVNAPFAESVDPERNGSASGSGSGSGSQVDPVSPSMRTLGPIGTTPLRATTNR